MMGDPVLKAGVTGLLPDENMSLDEYQLAIYMEPNSGTCALC